MQTLGQIIKEDDISGNVIPCNTEEYMAFYIGNHLTFIDSFQFMSSSLDQLTENLLENQFIYTNKVFGSLAPKEKETTLNLWLYG